MARKLTDTNQSSTMMESQGSSRMTMSRVTMVLALLTIVGIADFLLNVAALHFVRPDVNPVLEPMSNYAVGPYGFLFTAADIGLGLAALALTFGLYLSIAPPGRSYVGLFLLGLYGVSVLLAGMFPIRCRRRSYDVRHHPQRRRQHSVLWLPYRRDSLVFGHG
jgi:hypothetical protein